MTISFIKMQANGNDFIIIDSRSHEFELEGPSRISRLADRRFGIGCDQLILISKGTDGALGNIRFFNQDGSESQACGNGLRCVAWLLSREVTSVVDGIKTFFLLTLRGKTLCQVESKELVTVDMGVFSFEPEEIPLAPGFSPFHIDSGTELGEGIAVGMGNPHVVFFGKILEECWQDLLAPIENHPAFSEGVNIHLVERIDSQQAYQRTWERGVGPTLSCGSGACAIAAAGFKEGIFGRDVTLIQPKGNLNCSILENNHVLLTGPVAVVFSGWIPAFEGDE